MLKTRATPLFRHLDSAARTLCLEIRPIYRSRGHLRVDPQLTFRALHNRVFFKQVRHYY